MKRITIGLILCATLFLAAGCSNQQSANQHSANSENAKMEKTENKWENKTENTIFPKGEKAPAETFTGTVFVQILAPKPKTIIFQSPV